MLPFQPDWDRSSFSFEVQNDAQRRTTLTEPSAGILGDSTTSHGSYHLRLMANVI